MMNAAIQQKIQVLDFTWEGLVKKVDQLKEQQQRTKDLLTRRFHAGQLITYAELAAVAVGDSIELSKGVTCYRLPTHADNELAFVTEFQPRTIIKSHYHDCQEVVQILRGELFDFKTSTTHHDIAEYPALKEHELYSPNGTLCTVYFKK